MTYPPGSPGFPPAQPPTPFGAPTQTYSPPEDGPSKLPQYLAIAIAVLGLASYLASFAEGSSVGIALIATLLGGLLAGAGLLPKQKNRTAIVTVLALLSFLIVLAEVINNPDGISIGWGLILIIVFTALQAIVAIGALLLEAGVITPPAPRPKYDNNPYSQYGAPGQFYGQPGPQTPPQQQHGPSPQQQQQPQQRPGGYPPQFGSYPTGPGTGGFPAQGSGGFPVQGPQPGSYSGQGPQHGTQTPPTGFPSFSPPPGQQPGATPRPEHEQTPAAPSTPSGPPPS